MALDISCYQSAVGLARVSCPCADVPPDGYNDSESGLYIADEGLIADMGGFDQCGSGSIWDLLDAARNKAIRTFIADTNSLLIGTHKAKRSRWIGGLGRSENLGYQDLTTTYAAQRVGCAPIRGGYMKVTKIGGWFQNSGDVDVMVYDKHNEEIATATITVTGGKHTVATLDTPIELPMFDDYLDVAEYFFVYEVSAAPGLPAHNRMLCNCGGTFKGKYDADAPYFNSMKAERVYGMTYGWADWAMVGGWKGDTLTDFHNVTTTAPDNCYGLTLFAEFGCKTEEVLCAGTLNFSGNALAMSIAHAIKYKANEYFAADILSGTRLNRAQLANRETWVQMQANWRAKYNEHVNYIVTNADLNTNDCLTCKTIASMAVRGVFA